MAVAQTPLTLYGLREHVNEMLTRRPAPLEPQLKRTLSREEILSILVSNGYNDERIKTSNCLVSEILKNNCHYIYTELFK